MQRVKDSKPPRRRAEQKSAVGISGHRTKSAPVPRFYFDVREGPHFAPDNDGLEFPDSDAAQQAAAETATSIARETLPYGKVNEVTIRVRNEHGERVVTVRVTMQVERD
jgi:hypothetical protein